jgi:two-component system, NarL family, sensor histidine kinase DesK
MGWSLQPQRNELSCKNFIQLTYTRRMSFGFQKQEAGWVPGWVPYIWLAYLVFFLWDPISNHAGLRNWMFTGAGLVAFLTFYFTYFRAGRPWNVLCVAGIVLLGAVYAPFNGGAACFFIYASTMLPFAVETEITAVLGIALIVSAAVLEGWLLRISNGFIFPATFLSTFIGAGNVFFAQRSRHMRKLRMANAEIEHLAKVAERERIARDLHDVLGHTLSLITLKSELAGKLMDRDPAQAKVEIRDVEQTARQALADVRQAIRGYRSKGLEAEIKQARTTLETAGLHVDIRSSRVEMPATHESVLALVLREAVTNVVRHAQASRCLLRLERVDGDCYLEVHDDGRGGDQVEGSGLRGMRERVEALGGTVQRDTHDGTRLGIFLPIPSDRETVQA